MSAMTSQITCISIVCWTVCSGADQIKHQISTSPDLVRGIHRWSLDSPHKGPVKRKMFPFDDVMTYRQLFYTHLLERVLCVSIKCIQVHDDVIKWKHFPRNWPFVRGIHRSPVNSPHKGQWRGALMFSLICVWINDWVNIREAGDLRRYRARCDVNVMKYSVCRYNAVSFLENIHNRYPIACQWGRDMRCLLWGQAVIYVLLQSLEWDIQYRVISCRVTTALDCTWTSHDAYLHQLFECTNRRL